MTMKTKTVIKWGFYLLYDSGGHDIIRVQVIGCPPHPVTCILTTMRYNSGVMMWLKLFFITNLLFNSMAIYDAPNRTSPQVSGNEIIDAVNVMRVQYGLAPYAIDSGLMAIAQAQSDYQASITTMTHLRADGSGPTVSSENIAPGTKSESAASIVHRWTADYPHTITLIGFLTGLAGAGAATGKDGLIYYTLDVKNTGKALTGLTISSSTGGQSTTVNGSTIPASTIPAVLSLLTATPHPDGSVIHTIAYGQTLSRIASAYKLALKDLAAKNHIDQNSTIQIGQQLLLRPSSTPTEILTSPPTLVPSTSTSTPNPTATNTLPAATPTRAASQSLYTPAKWSSIMWIVVGLVSICILGICSAFLGGRFKRKH